MNIKASSQPGVSNALCDSAALNDYFMPVFGPELISPDVFDFYATHIFSDKVEEFQLVPLEPPDIFKIPPACYSGSWFTQYYADF